MIIDNVLPEYYADELEREIGSEEKFPWYFNSKTISKDFGHEQISGFTHGLYVNDKINSSAYNLVKEAVDIIFKKIEIDTSSKFQIKRIHRIQANLLIPTLINDKQKSNLFHVDDNRENYVSIIYYINDSDGDTVITEPNVTHHIKPKKNKCIYFPSNILHRPGLPTKTKRRMVLNIVVETSQSIV